MSDKKKTLGLAAGAVVGLVVAYSGWVAAGGMRQAADAQSIALDNMRAWRSAYEALAPVEARWQETYQMGVDSNRQDLVEIARSLRLPEAGLSYSDKGLRSDLVESVSYEGVQVGLTKTCVAGDGGDSGLAVTAGSMGGLIRGLERLVRKDLGISEIETKIQGGMPTARLGGLCVMVRNQEGV